MYVREQMRQTRRADGSIYSTAKDGGNIPLERLELRL